MTALLDVDDLNADAIHAIWQTAHTDTATIRPGRVAVSFEGSGIRTRTTFLQALQNLGLSHVELPNFLGTAETVVDLAGYMDPFFDLYVIRAGDHDRMRAFASASVRPLINAMSAVAHPCEVLTDGCWLHRHFGSLRSARILLWGPPTNVFRSWWALARVLDLHLVHCCPGAYRPAAPDRSVAFVEATEDLFDVVITDGWPAGFSDDRFTLTQEHLQMWDNPLLLPTPPVTVGQEIAFAPRSSSRFCGYEQKALLLPVQRAIAAHMLEHAWSRP